MPRKSIAKAPKAVKATPSKGRGRPKKVISEDRPEDPTEEIIEENSEEQTQGSSSQEVKHENSQKSELNTEENSSDLSKKMDIDKFTENNGDIQLQTLKQKSLIREKSQEKSSDSEKSSGKSKERQGIELKREKSYEKVGKSKETSPKIDRLSDKNRKSRDKSSGSREHTPKREGSADKNKKVSERAIRRIPIPHTSPKTTQSSSFITSSSDKQRILGPDETTNKEENPPSKYVHISNLVRPFMISDLQIFINEGKSIPHEDFWIDEIKSHCYIQFESVSKAQSVISRLNGERWPEHNKKRLVVEFAEAEKMLNDTRGKFNNTEDHHQAANEHPPEIVVQNFDSGHKNSAISEFFRRTTCEPHIYWLPSTDSIRPKDEGEVVKISK